MAVNVDFVTRTDHRLFDLLGIDAVPLLSDFTQFTLVSAAHPVPEPTVTLMLTLGLALLVMRARLRL
jgi:hypothetical protein